MSTGITVYPTRVWLSRESFGVGVEVSGSGGRRLPWCHLVSFSSGECSLLLETQGVDMGVMVEGQGTPNPRLFTPRR